MTLTDVALLCVSSFSTWNRASKPSLLQKRTRRRDLAFNSIRSHLSASHRAAAAALAGIGIGYISHYAGSANNTMFKVVSPEEKKTHNPHI